jgi:phospholipid transport system substrate-binding protein
MCGNAQRETSWRRRIGPMRTLPIHFFVALAALLALSGAAADSGKAGPDELMRGATAALAGYLKPDGVPRAMAPAKVAEGVEATVLPLFDLGQMAQLALARGWRQATTEQQRALAAEFKPLLLRAFAATLAHRPLQAIEVRPLRLAADATEVLIRSSVGQPGAEPMAIDYAMAKTAAGWKVLDVRVSGISLIGAFRANFTEALRAHGVDGLLRSMAASNRQSDAGLEPPPGGPRAAAFMYAVMTSAVRGQK